MEPEVDWSWPRRNGDAQVPLASARNSHVVASSFVRWDLKARRNLIGLASLAAEGFEVKIRNKVGPALESFIRCNRLDETGRLITTPGTVDQGYETWIDIVPTDARWVTVLHDDDEWIGRPHVGDVKAGTSGLVPTFANPLDGISPPQLFSGARGPQNPHTRLRRFEATPIPLLFGATRGDVWRTWGCWVKAQPLKFPSFDLQLSLSALLVGDVGRLPAFTYAYDSSNWATPDSRLTNEGRYWEHLGLPSGSVEFSDLFTGLDSLSLLACGVDQLDPQDARDWKSLLLARLWPLHGGRSGFIARLPNQKLRWALVLHRDRRAGRLTPRIHPSTLGQAYAYGLARAQNLTDVVGDLLPAVGRDLPQLHELGVIECWQESLTKLVRA